MPCADGVLSSCVAESLQARMEKERKEAEKAEVVAQANQQKQMLAGEVKSLRGEIQVMKGSMSNPLAGSPMKGGALAILPENVTEALERRKAFEEQFSMTLRSLREELMDTSIKRLSSRSQTPQGVRALLVLSDERIDRIMAEAAKVANPSMLQSVHSDHSLAEHEQCAHSRSCLATLPATLCSPLCAPHHTIQVQLRAGGRVLPHTHVSLSVLVPCISLIPSEHAHAFANACSALQLWRVCGLVTATGSCGRAVAY